MTRGHRWGPRFALSDAMAVDDLLLAASHGAAQERTLTSNDTTSYSHASAVDALAENAMHAQNQV